MIGLYNALVGLLLLGGLPLFLPLSLFIPRYRQGLGQRLGIGWPAAGRRDLWIHGASVGEVRAALPLLQALQARHPAPRVLATTTTATGQQILRDQGAAGVERCYLPLDFGPLLARAFDRFQPRLLCLLETELWPMLLTVAARRRVPILVLNGRISDRAYRRYRRWSRWLAPGLGRVTAFAMQSPRDAERIRSLGAPPDRVRVLGNLKYAEAPPREGPGPFAALTGRTVLTVGSTHEGEEGPILEAVRGLADRFPDLLCILAPRHPQRFDAVAALLTARGVRFQRRTRWDGTTPPPDPVLLLDTLGELPAAYAAADLVFLGGSLAPVGGHNLAEPAAAGKAICFGPHMDNFREMAADLLAQGAARQVGAPADLVPVLGDLLADRPARDRMGTAGQRFLEGQRAVLDRYLDLVESHLNPAESGAGAP